MLDISLQINIIDLYDLFLYIFVMLSTAKLAKK